MWGELWHHDGVNREQRNTLLRARDPYDYTYTEWIYGPTALTPEEEPPMCPVVPLDSVGGRAGPWSCRMEVSSELDGVAGERTRLREHDREETMVKQPMWIRLAAVLALVALLGFVLLQIL
ncbi:MAG TPA: hypothetical protein VFZ64_13070 [Nocardioidaceae bacterium]